MNYVRLNGEQEVKSKAGWEGHVYKNFGYRFRFVKDNATRFVAK